MGPRSAAFAPLCGYDFAALAGFIDVLLPKHYFWHRGFDGLYGTVARYVETLCAWNPEMSEPSALANGFPDAVAMVESIGFKPGRHPYDLWRRG